MMYILLLFFSTWRVSFQLQKDNNTDGKTPVRLKRSNSIVGDAADDDGFLDMFSVEEPEVRHCLRNDTFSHLIQWKWNWSVMPGICFT